MNHAYIKKSLLRIRNHHHKPTLFTISTQVKTICLNILQENEYCSLTVCVMNHTRFKAHYIRVHFYTYVTRILLDLREKTKKKIPHEALQPCSSSAASSLFYNLLLSAFVSASRKKKSCPGIKSARFKSTQMRKNPSGRDRMRVCVCVCLYLRLSPLLQTPCVRQRGK